MVGVTCGEERTTLGYEKNTGLHIGKIWYFPIFFQQRISPDELEELTKHTEDTIDALKEGADDTFDYIPSFSAVMMALVAAPIMKDYWTQKIDKDEAKKKMVSSLGSRVGSSAAKLFLLSTPMAPAVISWSLWRISSVLIRIASNKRRDLLIQ